MACTRYILCHTVPPQNTHSSGFAVFCYGLVMAKCTHILQEQSKEKVPHILPYRFSKLWYTLILYLVNILTTISHHQEDMINVKRKLLRSGEHVYRPIQNINDMFWCGETMWRKNTHSYFPKKIFGTLKANNFIDPAFTFTGVP